MTGNRDVFINCPYDAAYRSHFWAQIFAVLDSGFNPIATFSINNATTTRLDQIIGMIRQATYSIHDLRLSERARFNMPFELGIAMGLARSEVGAPTKRICVLTTNQERYEKTCSDLKGVDPVIYRRSPSQLAFAVAGWLQQFETEKKAPGQRTLMARFDKFSSLLPALAREKGFLIKEASWRDMYVTTHTYLSKNPPQVETVRL